MLLLLRRSLAYIQRFINVFKEDLQKQADPLSVIIYRATLSFSHGLWTELTILENCNG